MFIRVNNGHLRIRNGSTAVGCGFKMPKDVHYHIPSGYRVTFGEGVKKGNVEKVIEDIKNMIMHKKGPKKYIKF